MEKPNKHYYKYLISGALIIIAVLVGLSFKSQIINYYHNDLPVAWGRFSDPAYPFMAWSAFAFLALAMIFFIFQAWQEQNLLEAMQNQLKREMSLIAEKRNFVTLSSHYFRTPLTLVADGIELITGLKIDQANAAKLKASSNQLRINTEKLLATAIPGSSATSQLKPPKGLMRYMLGSAAVSFIAISLAIYILVNQEDFTHSIKLILVLSVALVVSSIVYSTYRSRIGRRQLKQYFIRLITDQRQLDANRNELMKTGLTSLKPLLTDIKTTVSQAGAVNPKAIRPVVEGLRQYEAIMQKFTILAGLQAGSMMVTERRVELNQLVDDIERRYANHMSQKGLSISRQLHTKTLNGDPLLLEFVLDCLVNNAIKYGAGGQPIKITSRRQRHKTIVITVGDQGPGIPPAKLALIFKPFSRAEDAAKDFEHQGIGLSLYLSKLIMRYTGGSINGDSQPKKGTRFNLVLPR